MATYTYNRDLLTTGDNINNWDLDNPDRVNGSLEQIYLAKEIEAAIPAKTLCAGCGTYCNNSLCHVMFTEELTAPEKAVLDTIVGDHKSNIIE